MQPQCHGPLSDWYLTRAAVTAIISVAGLCGCAKPFRHTETDTLTAPRTRRLHVENKLGDIVVRSDPGAERVRADVARIGRGSTDEEARKAAGAITVELALDPADEKTLRAVAEHPVESPSRGYEVRWTIVTPPDVSVDVKNGLGNVEIDCIHGDAVVDTGMGDVHVRGIIIPDAKPGAVDVHSGLGRITLRDVAGSCRASTGMGDIHAQCSAAGLHAETGMGSINAWAGGLVSLKTGMGSVTLRLAADAPGTVSAHSGMGDIDAALPADVRGRLVAETGMGSLILRLGEKMLQNTHHERGRFRADLNGSSDPAIRLTTGMGDITVR